MCSWAAQPPRDDAGLPASLGLGEQARPLDAEQADECSAVPPRMGPFHHPKCAVPSLLLSNLVAALTCAQPGSKHSQRAGSLVVPKVLVQACRGDSECIWFPGQPLGQP